MSDRRTGASHGRQPPFHADGRDYRRKQTMELQREYTLVDTGQRRQPKDREMYVYLPTGEIHNWEDSDFEAGGADRKDFAILALSVKPAPMTYKRAAELALQCQDGVNLSGILYSFKQA